MKWVLALTFAVGAASCATVPDRAEHVTWRFDNTANIGGFQAHVEGSPALVDSPIGKALQFDGVDDTVLIDGRPLVGAEQFTAEVVFRPEGGQFEQRFMHIAQTNPETGEDVQMVAGRGDRNPRFMFEVRVTDQGWYLDTFVNSAAGSKALIFPDKIYPLNRWYTAAQTYDGTTYRAYVNGVLQGESEAAFSPHGPGRVRIGARMNKVDYFTGSIAGARFTERALDPAELLTVSN
jgi:hypothetical protein